MSNAIQIQLGIELDLTKQELEGLISSRCPQRLLELVQSKRCKICGSSFFPEIEGNGALAGWECDLPETPMTRFFVDTTDGVLAVHQAEKMRRQQDEVPLQRRRIGADGGEEVTPGLVTRGWPNEIEENHRRIFHYGYNGE